MLNHFFRFDLSSILLCLLLSALPSAQAVTGKSPEKAGEKASQKRVIDKIAAMVNDEIITLSDLKAYETKLKSAGFSDELLVPDENSRQAALKDTQKRLEILIATKILDYEIKRQSLQATIERVEQEIRSIAERNRISRAELRQALQQQGTSMSEYQDMIRSQIERQALIERVVTSKIKISEEDVTAAFLAQRKDPAANVTYEYTIAHILFVPKGRSAESEAAAKRRGELVVERLKNKESFETLVSQFSDDSRLSSGGRLGTFKANELSKELLEGVRDLKVGEVSKLVRGRAGFHILKLEAKRAVTDPRLEAEKEAIRNRLYQAAFKKQFQFWLDQKRQEAIVRING